MVPKNYNFPSQYRGDTFDAVAFTFKDKDTGLPIDLSGTDIKCQFRSPFNAKIIKEIDLDDGILMISEVGGTIAIDEFLITWDDGVYNYDIQIIYPSGTTKTYVKGTVTVLGDTTT